MRTCVSEQGRSGLLWTVFDGEPFCSPRIASFADENAARDYVYRMPAELVSLRAQLAAAEAREKALREALEQLEWGMSSEDVLSIARTALANTGGGEAVPS